MLNSLDYRYKYLLSLLLIIILIVTVGYLARKNHGKKIYGMSNAIKTDTTSS